MAISNDRLVSIEEGIVTFRYKNYSREGRWQSMRLESDAFLRRFLLHVLPRGFVRIRTFGFMANRQRAEGLSRCRQLLGADSSPETPASPETESQELAAEEAWCCPFCGQGTLRVAAEIRRPRLPDLIARTYWGISLHDTW